MKWAGKKVLVTGADGFIASHLTEKLIDLKKNFPKKNKWLEVVYYGK